MQWPIKAQLDVMMLFLVIWCFFVCLLQLGTITSTANFAHTKQCIRQPTNCKQIFLFAFTTLMLDMIDFAGAAFIHLLFSLHRLLMVLDDLLVIFNCLFNVHAGLASITILSYYPIP